MRAVVRQHQNTQVHPPGRVRNRAHTETAEGAAAAAQVLALEAAAAAPAARRAPRGAARRRRLSFRNTNAPQRLTRVLARRARHVALGVEARLASGRGDLRGLGEKRGEMRMVGHTAPQGERRRSFRGPFLPGDAPIDAASPCIGLTTLAAALRAAAAATGARTTAEGAAGLADARALRSCATWLCRRLAVKEAIFDESIWPKRCL